MNPTWNVSRAWLAMLLIFSVVLAGCAGGGMAPGPNLRQFHA